MVWCPIYVIVYISKSSLNWNSIQYVMQRRRKHLISYFGQNAVAGNVYSSTDIIDNVK